MTIDLEVRWWCYVEGMNDPVARHPSIEAARREAQRLSKLVPGINVYILAAVERVVERGDRPKKKEVEIRVRKSRKIALDEPE